MDCRGMRRRQWIVENYNVVPVAHIQLLAGQSKHSDAGQTISNDYYIFEATSKLSGGKEIIQCGTVAARDFLALLHHKGIPVFNPLRMDGGTEGAGGQNLGDDGRDREDGVKWDPIARQLYNSIMWLIIIIDAQPNTPIFQIREQVYKFKERKPFLSRIKAINTIIKKTLPNMTLTQAINKLRVQNNVREDMCQFDLLIDEINHMVGDDENVKVLF